MSKNGAADPKTGKGKKKDGVSKAAMAATLASVVSHLEKMASTPASASGTTPGRLFATARDEKIERQGGFKTPREFMQAVIDAGRGRPLDKRLEALTVKTAGSDEQSTASDPYGGFLVPHGFVPNVLKVDPEADPMGSLTRKIPMSNPIIKIPSRVDKDHTSSVSGGVVVTRRAETLEGTSSRMKLEQVTLEAHSLFGFAYASEELLTDSPVSFAAILQAGFSDQFVSHVIDERLNGTGVGEYLGIMTAPCTISVAKEVGQAADTIVYENLLKMRARCWGYGKAVWIANHDCTESLMKLNQAVGTGGAVVWQPSAREDHPDILFGRPLIFSEYARTVGDQGDIVLGNWSEYLEATYQPLMSDESVHVRFVNHERTFKFWTRNAGAPWWRSALTPKRSANTLSPFVLLDARA